MTCKTKKKINKSTSQKNQNMEKKKNPKNEEMNKKLESHVKKMPNHANFDKIQQVSNVQCDPRLDASIEVISHNKG